MRIKNWLEGPLATARVQWLAVFLFISFGFVLYENMGFSNEVDVLPLARQFVQTDWMPHDWYLNQPAGYRLLFSVLAGHMIAAWGFLATSIVGRLLCYGLMAAGLVGIGRSLRLSLPYLLLAIAFFLYSWHDQGMTAKEWIVGGLEAKSVAYGWVLLAIATLLWGQERRTAALLGIATSFHVLVGGWAMLSALGVWLWRNRGAWSLPRLLILGALYGGGSAFAIPAVLKQLRTPELEAALSPSFIYVFLRLPHHLNPLAWNLLGWSRLALFTAVFSLVVFLLFQQRESFPADQAQACRHLILFVGLSMVPFVGGIALAAFDAEGRWLQYYPFRLGDVLLPLGTFLLLAVYVEQQLRYWNARAWAIAGMAMLVTFAIGQSYLFEQSIVKLEHYPNSQQGANKEWRTVCAWIQEHTPDLAVFITLPLNRNSFTWMAERAIVAHYKFLPQTANEILEWYTRIDQLTAGTLSKLSADLDTLRWRPNVGVQIREDLREGYFSLNTAGAIALMEEYQASYFLTRSFHVLDLPIAYRSDSYVLYQSTSL